jgi:hypothetical protein
MNILIKWRIRFRDLLIQDIKKVARKRPQPLGGALLNNEFTKLI